jgi:hypothetical protein
LTLLDEFNANAGGNKSYAYYTYCPDTYVNLSWGRTILNLVPGFFALMLIGIGIGLFYKVLRNEGLMGV